MLTAPLLHVLTEVAVICRTSELPASTQNQSHAGQCGVLATAEMSCEQVSAWSVSGKVCVRESVSECVVNIPLIPLGRKPPGVVVLLK